MNHEHSGRERKRLLILKGPAGSGKTATLSLLSKEMSIHIHEWKNPTSSLPSSEGFVSATAQFEDFIGRAGAFGSLAFEGPAQSHHQVAPPAQSGRQKQLVLVEEFPNTFTRGSSIIQSFRSSVLKYLVATTPSATSFFSSNANLDQPVTPVVMIISETLLSTNTASADSFTAHRLLGPEITRHPGAGMIEFNAIAPTLLAAALDLIVKKEARKSGRKRTPGPLVLKRLGEIGDIRSAVSSLEFLCLKGDDEADWGSRVTFTKPKRGAKDTVALTKGEQESLELVTQRGGAVVQVVRGARCVVDRPGAAGGFSGVSDVCGHACTVHGHAHGAVAAAPVREEDLAGFWGALGCSCWAV